MGVSRVHIVAMVDELNAKLSNPPYRDQPLARVELVERIPYDDYNSAFFRVWEWKEGPKAQLRWGIGDSYEDVRSSLADAVEKARVSSRMRTRTQNDPLQLL